IRIEGARGEVRVHRAPRRPRIASHIGIRVELREKFIERRRTCGEHEGLIAVIAGAKITVAERARHRQLRDFLAIAENAELRLAGENLFPADEARLAAAVRHTIVIDDALACELRTGIVCLLWCGHLEVSGGES